MTGNGRGTGTNNRGILVDGAGRIESTSGATLGLTGTGSSTGTSGNNGILITGANSRVTTTLGAATLQGMGGGTTTDNAGIQLASTGFVESTTADSTAGDITLIAGGIGSVDYISLSNGSVRTKGKVNLEPIENSTSIGIGNSSTGNFNLNSTDIAAIISGNSGLRIGKTTGTGAVNIRAQTFNTDVTILTPGAGSAGITQNGIITQAINKNITLVTGSTYQNTAGPNALGVNGVNKYYFYIYAPSESSLSLGGLTINSIHRGTFTTLPPSSIPQNYGNIIFPAPVVAPAPTPATLRLTSFSLQNATDITQIIVPTSTPTPVLESKPVVAQNKNQSQSNNNNEDGEETTDGEGQQFAIMGKRDGYDQITDRMIDLRNLNAQEQGLLNQMGRIPDPEANRVLNRALQFADDLF